jgi:hypothetical protein
VAPVPVRAFLFRDNEHVIGLPPKRHVEVGEQVLSLIYLPLHPRWIKRPTSYAFLRQVALQTPASPHAADQWEANQNPRDATEARSKFDSEHCIRIV